MREQLKKKKNVSVSRRNFLTKGSTGLIAAGAAVIAVQSSLATNAKAGQGSPTQMLSNDPVYTESVQTLKNKTIKGTQNDLQIGTDGVNIREFSINGTNITVALNEAIQYLAGTGGQILIPRGYWNTYGGHDLKSSIMIEGVGSETPNGSINATKIKYVSNSSDPNQKDFMFRIKTNEQNIGLKNMSIELPIGSKTGLLMTNHEGANTFGTTIYFTHLENISFAFGLYGIKIDSLNGGTGTNFECIMNRFDRLTFYQCKTAVYCNSVNGGYSFDTCYFQVPDNNGTALDFEYMGYVSFNNCLFVGVPGTSANGSTVLKTLGAFGGISFYNCQDEAVEYFYKNSTNDYSYVPLVFRSCAVQGQFKFNAHGSVIFDSCRINATNTGASSRRIQDSPNAVVAVSLKGLNDIFAYTGNNILENFQNTSSHILYESNEIGKLVVEDISNTPNYFVVNSSRGAVNIKSGTSSILVYNKHARTDSIIFAQLRTSDSGGAFIRNVECGSEYFIIHLNKNASNTLSVGFKLENGFF